MIPDYAILFSGPDYELMLKEKISFDAIVDARNLKQKQYREIAAQCGHLFVYTGRACTKGHFIKLRTGRCPTCSPSSLGMIKRFRKPGFVYVARSHKGRLTKIGITQCLQDRIDSLNKEGYAGFCDWKIKRYIWSNAAGELESTLQRILEASRQSGIWYFKGQQMLEAREVFKVPVNIAIRHLESFVLNY